MVCSLLIMGSCSYNILSIKTLFNEVGVEEKEAIPAWKPLVRDWRPACSVEGEGGEALLLITCFSIGP